MRIFFIIYNVELQASAKEVGGEGKKSGVLLPGILLFINRGITGVSHLPKNKIPSTTLASLWTLLHYLYLPCQ